MRKFLTAIILYATLPVGELHRFWKHDLRVQDWIIAADKPMPMQWNVKYAGLEVIAVMIFVAMAFYRHSRVNVIAVRAFMLLAICELFLYFYNFKAGPDFGRIYIWFAACIIISWFWNRRVRDSTFKTIHPE